MDGAFDWILLLSDELGADPLPDYLLVEERDGTRACWRVFADLMSFRITTSIDAAGTELRILGVGFSPFPFGNRVDRARQPSRPESRRPTGRKLT